jgi:hypothetical protein
MATRKSHSWSGAMVLRSCGATGAASSRFSRSFCSRCMNPTRYKDSASLLSQYLLANNLESLFVILDHVWLWSNRCLTHDSLAACASNEEEVHNFTSLSMMPMRTHTHIQHITHTVPVGGLCYHCCEVGTDVECPHIGAMRRVEEMQQELESLRAAQVRVC